MRRREVLTVGLGTITGLAGYTFWTTPTISPRIRERPRKLKILRFENLERMANHSIATLVRRRLRLSPQMTFSDLLHWLRIFAVPGSSEYQAESRQAVLSLLTDARQIEKRYGQRGVIVPTNAGARFLSRLSGVHLKDESRPAHPYQEVAIFGEIGLPSTTVIKTDAEEFTLIDVIRDCLSNLQIREANWQEPEWATQVLLYYLPQAVSWQNRWGEELTFEQWIKFLIDRDAAKYSCCGTHLLHSLALILQANSQRQILSRRLLEHVRHVCKEFSLTIEATQHADGAWRTDWSRDEIVLNEYAQSGIHLTGHILEAQLYLPRDIRISDRSFGLALRYVIEVYQTSNAQTVFDHYCFYSHAGHVLLQYAASSPPTTISS